MRMEQGGRCLEAAGAWLVFYSSQGARFQPPKLSKPRLGPHQPRGIRAGLVASWGDSKYPRSTSARPWALGGSQVGSQAGARREPGRSRPCLAETCIWWGAGQGPKHGGLGSLRPLLWPSVASSSSPCAHTKFGVRLVSSSSP